MVSEVFNIDCMVGMAQYPDKYFDLAVVDPPYGIGDDKLTQGGTWAAKYKSGDAQWDVAPDQEFFNELFRVSKNQIVWGGNYFQLPVSRGFIIWDKVSHMPTMADCEYAWISFDKNAKIFKCNRSGNQTGEKRIHICQKPVKLYSWIYDKYLPNGGKVLDTHLGSGSNRIAAHKAGNIDFTAYEIDKEYFDAQEKRYKDFASQLVLF